MLNHPTYERLAQLRLTGMAKALAEQAQTPEILNLTFEERLGLLLEVELTRRTNNRLKRRIQAAGFPLQALHASSRALACVRSRWISRASGRRRSSMGRSRQRSWPSPSSSSRGVSSARPS